MSAWTLKDFLDRSGNKPYRELIESQVQERSGEEILVVLKHELEYLPPWLVVHIEKFLEALRARLGADHVFWASATCRTAAASITEALGQVVPSEDFLDAFAATIRDGRKDLSLSMFQIATLNFAHWASCQPELRRIMGMREVPPN
jgi:hypothetical protein